MVHRVHIVAAFALSAFLLACPTDNNGLGPVSPDCRYESAACARGFTCSLTGVGWTCVPQDDVDAGLDLSVAPDLSDFQLGQRTCESDGYCDYECVAPDDEIDPDCPRENDNDDDNGNRCPTSVARIRLRGSDEWTESLAATIGAVVELDGSDSFDPYGGGEISISGYEWSFLSGGGTFEGTQTEAEAAVTIELHGESRIELKVRDSQGLASCQPAIVSVTVPEPHTGISVRLEWDTPGNLNPNGTGRAEDMNLHFLHPSGEWDSAPWDVFYWNLEPNWGDPNSTADDPVMIQRRGSEEIHYSSPEGSLERPVTYAVGVYYFYDWDYGSSTPTLQIWIGEEEVQEFSPEVPLADRQFWDAVRISWPSGEIEVIDKLYPEGVP